MSDPYIDLETLLETFYAQLKEELEELGIFDKISEGEDLYEEGIEAWVIPGMDRITHTGMAQVTHTITVHVIIFSSAAEGATQSDLRTYAYKAYDKFMADLTHNGTCWKCLPTLFHPGYLRFGETLYVGVLMNWDAAIHQAYVLP